MLASGKTADEAAFEPVVGIAADHLFRQRRGQCEERPVAHAECGGGIGERAPDVDRGNDVEEHGTLDGRGAFEHQAVGGAGATVVGEDAEAVDAEEAGRVLAELAAGTPRKRVGLLLDGRQAAREGAAVFAGNQEVGVVTSGGFSPSLERPIAMAYVTADQAAESTALSIDVRGKRLTATVSPLPFVPHRYHRKGAAA